MFSKERQMILDWTVKEGSLDTELALKTREHLSERSYKRSKNNSSLVNIEIVW